MKTDADSILLVGASGFLGAELCHSLTASGLTVRPTTRCSGLQLDLEKSVSEQLAGKLQSHAYSHGILCAAMTDVGQCFVRPDASRRINVDAILELLTLFQEFRIKPVFFSSDLVFDGFGDLYCEDDDVCPTTLYGRQKAAIELEIQKRFTGYIIFRTSKLMSMDLRPRNILTPVIENLHAGVTIKAFSDQFVTPVFVEDIARVLIAAFRKGLNGLFHLAGEERLSRFELAQAVANVYNLPASRVAATRIQDIALSEPRGPNNTLNSAKIRRALDFRFTPLAGGLARIEGLEILRAQKAIGKVLR